MTDDVPNSKLIATKEKWAKEGRGLSGKGPQQHTRLPVGQHLVNGLPVLDLGIQPDLALKDWSLTIGGMTSRKLVWSWDDLLAQPQMEILADIHCVTTWSSYDNLWHGVSGRHILEAAGVKDEAKFVMLRSFDGYTTNLPIEFFAAPDALVAHRWQDQPIPKENGGPVRMVVPQLYFWKSAKWIRAITFMEKDAPGYWEQHGYHNVGDPWNEERYS